MTILEAKLKLNGNHIIGKLKESFLKIRNNGTVDDSIIHYMLLTGGAIIDILHDRTPKDFDFINIPTHVIEQLPDCGYDFISDSSTAMTFRHRGLGYTIQILKTNIEDFDFTISASLYYLHGRNLKIDIVSFNTNTLIPNNWDSRTSVISALRRIPHYRDKGFNISDVTYQSLLNKALKQEYNIKNS